MDLQVIYDETLEIAAIIDLESRQAWGPAAIGQGAGQLLEAYVQSLPFDPSILTPDQAVEGFTDWFQRVGEYADASTSTVSPSPVDSGTGTSVDTGALAVAEAGSAAGSPPPPAPADTDSTATADTSAAQVTTAPAVTPPAAVAPATLPATAGTQYIACPSCSVTGTVDPACPICHGTNQMAVQ